jgi:hypothetical protein
MTKTLTFEVSDALYEAFEDMAAKYGRSLEAVALEWLAQHTPKPRKQLTEEESQEAWARLQRHVGAVSLGHPTHMDNASIEADLARAYEDTHEQEQ